MTEMSTDDIRDTIRRHFDKRAPTFDAGSSHDFKSPAMRVAWYDKVRAWTGRAPIDVLDCGCATGFFALIAAELGHRARGLDLSPGMVAEARRKAAANGVTAVFLQGDATEPPIDGKSVDLILERHLLWTLQDPATAVSRWRKLLRPGGRLISVGMDWRTLVKTTTGDDYAPFRRRLPLYGGRSADDIVRLYEAAGYADLNVEWLRDDVYWHDGIDVERYAIHARNPV
jgi:SAM-dependent methyltransferase